MTITTAQTKTINGLTDEVETRLPSTLICFSHLRWNFVYQRPQHLLSRFATRFNVFYVEEPYWDGEGEGNLTLTLQEDSLWVVAPHLPAGINEEEANRLQRKMLDKLVKTCKTNDLLFWYYTPMALAFSGHLNAGLIVYDCMDELAAFKNAPQKLKDYEQKLIDKADIVFTGGHSLYKAKKHRHANIFSFPSSIEKKHFEHARYNKQQPADQQNIPGIKLGFYGVIDERFDIELLRGMAEAKPEWSFVILGPVVKINRASLPTLPNIYYLGSKNYNELPGYLSGWDVALIPFMLNESTRFISPTKTPEYLAAGKPVISTPITDVVSPYGEGGYVEIATDAKGFVKAAERLLELPKEEWLKKTDTFLNLQSWSLTYKAMMQEIVRTLGDKHMKTEYTTAKIINTFSTLDKKVSSLNQFAVGE